MGQKWVLDLLVTRRAIDPARLAPGGSADP